MPTKPSLNSKKVSSEEKNGSLGCLTGQRSSQMNASISNSILFGKHVVHKPWGVERLLERNQFYTVKEITIYPGKRLSRQYHNFKIESIQVIEGRITFEDGESLGPGDFLHIPPKTVHRFSAPNNGNKVRLLEVSHGDDQDIVRLHDDYGR